MSYSLSIEVPDNRVLPWLQKLCNLINPWHDTAMAGERLGMGCAVS